MSKLGQDRLPTVDDALDARAAHTHAGQAHFAEATSAHSCSECSWFRPVSRNDQRGRCKKAANISMRPLFSMPAFPGSARACKFFDAEEPQG